MTLPSPISVRVRYADIARAAGLTFKQDATATDQHYYLETMGKRRSWPCWFLSLREARNLPAEALNKLPASLEEGRGWSRPERDVPPHLLPR